MTQITLDISDLDNLELMDEHLAAVWPVIISRIEKIGAIFEAEFKETYTQRVPSQSAKGGNDYTTGATRASLITQRQGNKVFIGSNLLTSLLIEEGVKPHFITPLVAKALKFEIGGEEVFAQTVFHPGYDGVFYMRDSIDPAAEKAVDKIVEWIGQEVPGSK